MLRSREESLEEKQKISGDCHWHDMILEMQFKIIYRYVLIHQWGNINFITGNQMQLYEGQHTRATY